jgi:hypothetical protein
VARKHDEVPKWLARKNYGYLRTLDAAGWLRELQRCAFLDNEAKTREAKELTFEEEWPGPFAAGFIPCYIGPPAVRAVDKADPESLGVLQKHVFTLEICLGANDADIMAGVKKELLRARERYPSPARKPGPQSLNGTFGDVEFARWRKHRIVEISDLLDRASREGRALSNADLGRSLFNQYSDPDKAAHKALKERERAFASIPALWMQVQALPIIRSN